MITSAYELGYLSKRTFPGGINNNNNSPGCNPGFKIGIGTTTEWLNLYEL